MYGLSHKESVLALAWNPGPLSSLNPLLYSVALRPALYDAALLFLLLRGIISAAECVGPGCPWSLGHWPALILYLDRSFEKAPESTFGALCTMPQHSTIATRGMFLFTDDRFEFCATASPYK